jgi:hypothetical protein
MLLGLIEVHKRLPDFRRRHARFRHTRHPFQYNPHTTKIGPEAIPPPVLIQESKQDLAFS